MATLKELIDQYGAELGRDYGAIADVLNAPTVIDNPTAGEKSTATVQPAPTLPDVLALVPSAERVKIRQLLPGFNEDVKGAIDSGSAIYMAGLIEDALTATAISAETAGELAALLTPTEVETTAPATIAGPSLAQAAGLDVVTPAQVQAALNS